MDNVVLKTKRYRHHNYALRYCICQEQKYTVENKNIRKQTEKQFNVSQKHLTVFVDKLTDITLTQNKTTVCVVVTKIQKQPPTMFPLCIQQQPKYIDY